MNIMISLDDLNNVIAPLLKNAEKQLQNPTSVSNYPTLKQAVVRQELVEEIAALKEMLKTPETFVEEFKKRCQQRASANQNTALSFNAMPDGTVNQLYWQITQQIFKSTTLDEHLAIILPDIKQSLLITYPDKLPGGLSKKESKKAMLKLLKNPILEEQPINESKKELPKNLSGFVITKNTLLDLNEINKRPFIYHQGLHQVLNDEHPDLAYHLYTHNDDWTTLSYDVSEDRTPREAIEQLIEGLKKGGAKFSGSEEHAAPIAKKAYLRFLYYWHYLPKELKEKLDTLTFRAKNFSDIREHLKNDDCVETAAVYLEEVLNEKNNADILNTRPYSSEEQTKLIEQKYRTSALDVKHINFRLPDALSQRVFQNEKIEINESEDFEKLLFSFPSNYYQTLFSQIKLNYPKDLLENLAEYIQLKQFNPEQLAALIDAIKNNVDKLGGPEIVTYFATLTRDNNILFTILKALKPEQIITIKDRHNCNLIIQAINCGDDQFLREILGCIQNDQAKVTAFIDKDNHGYSALDYVWDKPVKLQILLSTFSTDERKIAFFKAKNGNISNWTSKNFCEFLYSFLPDSYKEVLSHAQRHGEKLSSELLCEIFSVGIFNEKQLVALADAIVKIKLQDPKELSGTIWQISQLDKKNCGIFLAAIENNINELNQSEILLSALMSNNYPDFYSALLKTIDPKRMIELKYSEAERNIVATLTFTTSGFETNPAVSSLLKTVLAHYENDTARLAAFIEKSRYGVRAIDNMMGSAEKLEVALNAFSTDEAKLNLLKQSSQGTSLFDSVAESIKRLQYEADLQSHWHDQKKGEELCFQAATSYKAIENSFKNDKIKTLSIEQLGPEKWLKTVEAILVLEPKKLLNEQNYQQLKKSDDPLNFAKELIRNQSLEKIFTGLIDLEKSLTIKGSNIANIKVEQLAFFKTNIKGRELAELKKLGQEIIKVDLGCKSLAADALKIIRQEQNSILRFFDPKKGRTRTFETMFNAVKVEIRNLSSTTDEDSQYLLQKNMGR